MHVDQVLADIRLHSLCASVAGSHGAELAVAWLIGAAASPQAADLQSARSTSLRASWTAMALYSVDLPLARPMYLQLLFQASAGQQPVVILDPKGSPALVHTVARAYKDPESGALAPQSQLRRDGESDLPRWAAPGCVHVAATTGAGAARAAAYADGEGAAPLDRQRRCCAPRPTAIVRGEAYMDSVIASLEVVAETGTPAGALFHAGGPSEGGYRIVEVWKSRAAADAFYQSDVLRKATAGLTTEPRVTMTWQVSGVDDGSGWRPAS